MKLLIHFKSSSKTFFIFCRFQLSNFFSAFDQFIDHVLSVAEGLQCKIIGTVVLSTHPTRNYLPTLSTYCIYLPTESKNCIYLPTYPIYNLYLHTYLHYRTYLDYRTYTTFPYLPTYTTIPHLPTYTTLSTYIIYLPTLPTPLTYSYAWSGIKHARIRMVNKHSGSPILNT